ncbi:protein C8orf37 isoform X1 [Ixodes scapularis]|uniref:protein C8orf37 isoform X1 n=1 Tax=Ixodes scapularis TaxID=6945 RepID=UPI001C388260|nr:protein C8orf37 isoform X1 [Ixodes scapularis]
MDDLDVLLDDVESKYCAARKFPPTPTLNQPRPPSSPNSLNEAINEICSIPDTDVRFSSEEARETAAGTHKAGASTERTRQCYVVHLAGTETARGLSTSVTKRACDRLHCFQCDFQVCSFDGFAWNQATDYLFLRNNVPELERLRPQLARQPGTATRISFTSSAPAHTISDVAI